MSELEVFRAENVKASKTKIPEKSPELFSILLCSKILLFHTNTMLALSSKNESTVEAFLRSRSR